MNEPSIHPSAYVGPEVKIAPGAAVGPNCVLRGDISIGARATLGAGVSLDGDAVIGAECRIEAGVALTEGPRDGGPLVLGTGVHVGAGSVLTPGIKIGAGSRIEAGTVVTRSVPAHAIVEGNPASVAGFATSAPPLAFKGDSEDDVVASVVAGVKLYRFPQIRDPRGCLTVGEFGVNIPFVPKRYFMVYDVPPSQLRGTHAHATCEELLVCTVGSIAIVVDDGVAREEYTLDRPDIGLYVPAMVWGTQYKHSPDAVLLVFASNFYDPQDYIVDYERFVIERKQAR